MSVSMKLVGNCIGSLVPGGARSWIFSSLAFVVHKLPSCENGVNKGAGPSGVYPCFDLSSSYSSSDTIFVYHKCYMSSSYCSCS